MRATYKCRFIGYESRRAGSVQVLNILAIQASTKLSSTPPSSEQKMKPSASFPKLTTVEARLPSMSAQADGFPEGWTIRRVPSSSGSGIVMNMYYSPISNFRFCGIAAARRFLNCLNETGGNDEEAACQLFQKETSDVESSIKVKTEYDQFGTAASNTIHGKAASTAAVASSNNTAERINNHAKVKEERKLQKSKYNQDEQSRKPHIAATEIKFEADTDTVYDSDIKVIDDDSGDKVGDNQKMELVDLTTESDVLLGGRGGDTNVSQQKEDKRREKLIKLTPEQAEETKYPQGCKVIYGYKHDASSNSTCISMGVVLSVNVSLKGDFVYELKTSSASKNNAEKVLMVDESSLAYAPTSPVFFQPDSSQASRKEGTVLLVKRSGDDETGRYSVLTVSDEGEYIIKHNVIHDQLSFRSVPTTKSNDSSGTKTPPTLQSNLEAKDDSVENSLKPERDKANAAPQPNGENRRTSDIPGQVSMHNRKDNEGETGILAETEDAEMLSILGEQQFHKRNIHKIWSESQARKEADCKDANKIKANGGGSSKKTKKRRKNNPPLSPKDQGMTEAQRIYSEQFKRKKRIVV